MSAILQGTTPYLRIGIKDSVFQISDVDEIELTLDNAGAKTRKRLADCTIDTENNRLLYHFTEAETLALSLSGHFHFQIRFQIGAEIVGTGERHIDVAELLSGESFDAS